MPKFEHIRHKPPSELTEPRPIVLVSAPLRSSVNLSRMVRLAGGCGVTRLIHCGPGKVDREIARDAADYVTVETRSSLPPVLDRLRGEGFHLVGLEQTTNSQCLYEYRFTQKTALIIGAEREGLSDEALSKLDAVVEIPVYGKPASHNVVTATTMALYEYCRQFPTG
ncbi:MAG: TrmH family RNA methyltransferase [Pirellulales bacterium]